MLKAFLPCYYYYFSMQLVLKLLSTKICPAQKFDIYFVIFYEKTYFLITEPKLHIVPVARLVSFRALDAFGALILGVLNFLKCGFLKFIVRFWLSQVCDSDWCFYKLITGVVGGGSFKICLSRKCCAARIRSLKGGTGFPGVNLAHDGNEFRLVWNCVHSIYFLFKVPWVSGPNLKTGMPFWH